MAKDLIQKHIESVTPEGLRKFKKETKTLFASASGAVGLTRLYIRCNGMYEVHVNGEKVYETRFEGLACRAYAEALTVKTAEQ